MFAILGFVFSLVFGLVFGTSKFALRNAVRIGAFSLVGYLVYELVTGYTHGKAGLPAPAAPAEPSAPRAGRSSPMTGRTQEGRTVQVSDGSGIEHTARVGRGVVSR